MTHYHWPMNFLHIRKIGIYGMVLRIPKENVYKVFKSLS